MDAQQQTLPLNLLNHFNLKERDYLGFGDRVYSLNNTEISLVKGEAHVSLDFLLPKSGYVNIDMSSDATSIPRNYAPAFKSKNYTEKVTFSTTQADPVGVEPEVRDSIMRAYQDYWNTLTSVAVPYLPFVSNCEGYDSTVPLFQLLEHDNCTLIEIENTQELMNAEGFSVTAVPVNVSDTCDISIKCRHEDRYNAKRGKKFWFEMNMATGAKGVFKISRYPVPLSFLNSAPWSNAPENAERLHDAFTLFEQVIVKPLKKNDPVYGSEDHPKSSDTYPKIVIFEIKYFQMTTSFKSIAKVEIGYRDWEKAELDNPASSPLPEYTLRFVMNPFSFLDVLDNFGFDIIINVIFTTIVAIFVLIIVILLRTYGKANTVVIPRPPLAINLYFINIVKPALSGVVLFIGPLYVLLGILYLVFKLLKVLEPWDANNSVSDELTIALVQQFNYQRFGVLFFVSGVYILVRASRAVVPIPQKEQIGTFSQQSWFKTHFLFCKVLFIIFQCGIVLFTKMAVFKENVNTLNYVLLGVQAGFMNIMTAMLPDLLLMTSFQMVKQLIAKTCSLGVAPFTGFLIQYLIQLATSIITRAILPTVMKVVNRIVEQLKTNRSLKRCGLNLLYRFMPTKADELDRGMRTGGAALKSRGAYKGAEILMLELAVKDLNTNAVLFVAAIFSPLFILFIVMFSTELGISTDFGGIDLQFYIYFGIIMLMFQFLYDILVSNCMETAYGWKLNAYLFTARKTFVERKAKWILNDADPAGIEYIQPNLRRIHKMAFSNQFYFVASALTYGTLLSVYGAAACVYNGYQLYRDNLMVPLCILMMILCWSIEVVSLKLARTVGLWYRIGEEGRLEILEIHKQRVGATSSGGGGDGIEMKEMNMNSITAENGGNGEKDDGSSEEEEEIAMNQNLQYRALTRIGVGDDSFETFDSRLSQIHEAPSGLTASEMSFTITSEVFSVVLSHWQENWVGQKTQPVDWKNDKEEEVQDDGSDGSDGSDEDRKKKTRRRRPEGLPSQKTEIEMVTLLSEKSNTDDISSRSSNNSSSNSSSNSSKRLGKSNLSKEISVKKEYDLPGTTGNEIDIITANRTGTLVHMNSVGDTDVAVPVGNEYVCDSMTDPGGPMPGWI